MATSATFPSRRTKVGPESRVHPTNPPGREFSAHLAVAPRDRAEPSGPIGPVVRPADPGRLVRLPLRRQPPHFLAAASAFSRRVHVEKPAGDPRVGVDAAVAQEGA